MENSSKALLMAAEVLVGVLLLSLMATLFYVFTNYQSEMHNNQVEKEIYQFNSKFISFEGKALTAQDVLTIVNIAKDYNRRFENEERIKIVGVNGASNTNEFLNSDVQKKYEIKQIKYNEDKKINYIQIGEKN